MTRVMRHHHSGVKPAEGEAAILMKPAPAVLTIALQ
jgi:hypothetical protein